ncbi:hypothetical protein BC826DRAFT_969150 [Russula brevipes]|nr:hypothetical protein BC826DRAFT_969150 [Russula brevipes]
MYSTISRGRTNSGILSTRRLEIATSGPSIERRIKSCFPCVRAGESDAPATLGLFKLCSLAVAKLRHSHPSNVHVQIATLRLSASIPLILALDLQCSMDTVGWPTLRKAAQQVVQPMGDAFIGGWAHTCIGTNPSTPSAARHQWERRCSIGHSFVLQTGYPFLHEPPRPASTIRPGVRPSFDENLLPQLNPVERSRITNLAGASTYTFWRFLIQIPLGDSEMEIHYSINNGNEMLFFVPGRQQTMRLAAYSHIDRRGLMQCNGFSFYANTDEFCGPGFHDAYDP